MENNKTTILVIEEHPMMRESLVTAIVAETDLQVMESSPVVSDAFEIEISPRHDVLFLAQQPDIILLALGNPGIEELKALSSLRKKMPGTFILAFTRAEVPGQEMAALAHGAQAVLPKSISRVELIHILREIRAGAQVILSPAM